MMDLNITLGDVLSAATSIVAIVGAYMRLADRMSEVKVKVDLMWRIYERRATPRGEE